MICMTVPLTPTKFIDFMDFTGRVCWGKSLIHTKKEIEK